MQLKTDADGYIRFEVLNPSKFREACAAHPDDQGIMQLLRNKLYPLDLVYDTEPSGLFQTLYERETINIYNQDDGVKFHGGAEVFQDLPGTGYIQPSVDGSRLDEKQMHLYECLKCNKEVTTSNRKRPYLCECGSKQFKANFPAHLQKPVWMLPEKPIETEPYNIYNHLIEFYQDHLVLREQEYHVLAAWTMASWLVDDFQTCPYIACIAPMSSGKTQVLEAIRQTAYRAYNVASVTPAAIFRAIEAWSLTLCIDEAEHQMNSNTESGQAIYACLLAGYKRGVGAMRAEKMGDDWLPTSFDLFSFKAFSGTQIVLPTLASRSIEFRLHKAKPAVDMFHDSEGEQLRSMLLWFRFSNLGKLRIAYPKSSDGRIRELYAPLFTVAKLMTREVKENLEKMLDETISTKRSDDQDSIEAEIIQAINELSEHDPGTLTGERVFVYLSELIDMLGWDKTRSSSIQLGKALKAMSIQTRHTKQGKVIDLYDGDNETQLKYLMERYL
jgi:DNA-directed RNA polymerase subunit RPC12/RpoP